VDFQVLVVLVHHLLISGSLVAVVVEELGIRIGQVVMVVQAAVVMVKKVMTLQMMLQMDYLAPEAVAEHLVVIQEQ
jgi:hypothetical protein|tara:strand:- start:767 stop:994 length:228 start_codon:yes stop_codon:yes gene_type:complete